MPEAIYNTSPLLYLHRINKLELLSSLFTEVWIPGAVVTELREGRKKGYDVPEPNNYGWLRIIEPQGHGYPWDHKGLRSEPVFFPPGVAFSS